MASSNIIVSVSGPSCVGKTKTIKELCGLDKRYKRAVSSTSRLQREDETDGVDYNFISKADFIQKIQAESFIYWKVSPYGFYGLDKASFESTPNKENIVVLDIDVDALIELRRREYNIVSFFLLPPSMEIIQHRLYNRGSKRGISTESDARVRFKESVKMLDYVNLYDYVLVNDNDNQTAGAILQIMQTELIKQNKNKLISDLRQEVIRYKLEE